ncbi:MAG TPA: cupin domain-containing protein [Alphaproteobacteria bacterium]
MADKIRRIVTGHDANGRSAFLSDGHATRIFELPSVPGLVLTDLWETTDAPADNSGDKDAADRPVHLEPAPRGTIFRVVEFPPDASWQGKTDAKAAFEAIGAGHAKDAHSSNPMMHKTASVDYAIVLKGEIWAILDTGERRMTAGDVLIQRGTNHAWSNRTDAPALVAFILVGAEPL